MANIFFHVEYYIRRSFVFTQLLCLISSKTFLRFRLTVLYASRLILLFGCGVEVRFLMCPIRA